MLWDSCRQAFVTQSTAESELVGHSSAHQAGEALSALIETVNNNQSLQKLLYGDNKAALSATGSETGPWRTRHLRIRAHALREAVRRLELGWQARHMPEAKLLADGLTKVLMGAAFNAFRLRAGVIKRETCDNLRDKDNVTMNNKVTDEIHASQNDKATEEKHIPKNVKASGGDRNSKEPQRSGQD